jgi:hypothetical protein
MKSDAVKGDTDQGTDRRDREVERNHHVVDIGDHVVGLGLHYHDGGEAR